jgi:hypothetical protein
MKVGKKQMMKEKEPFDLEKYRTMNIIKNGSAYTNDIGHIKSFGDEKSSPFEKPLVTMAKPSVEFPLTMGSNGFVKSNRIGLLKNIQNDKPKLPK